MTAAPTQRQPLIATPATAGTPTTRTRESSVDANAAPNPSVTLAPHAERPVIQPSELLLVKTSPLPILTAAEAPSATAAETRPAVSDNSPTQPPATTLATRRAVAGRIPTQPSPAKTLATRLANPHQTPVQPPPGTTTGSLSRTAESGLVKTPVATLPDMTVVVRPASLTDTHAVQRFLGGLSLESSYRRFFTGLGRIPDAFARRLVDVDHARREALVAVVGDAVVGLADYALLTSHPNAAEFGVVVADSWQRRGLGPRLVGELIMVAQGRGVTRLRVHTLAENARVLRLLRRRWPNARPEREDTMLIWDLPL
jgi:GNAT superfamily N-acetyltransferase